MKQARSYLTRGLLFGALLIASVIGVHLSNVSLVSAQDTCDATNITSAEMLNNAIVNANDESTCQGPNTIQLSGSFEVDTPTSNDNYLQEGPNAFAPITSDITIDGAGNSISRAEGANNFRFFIVDAKDANGRLTLTSIELFNGNSADGGAIFIEGAPAGTDPVPTVLTIYNTTIRDNVATNAAGAIFLDGSSDLTLRVEIANTILSGNTGPQGGALYNDVRNNGTIVIELNNVRIVQNTGTREAGAFYSNSVGGSGTITINATNSDILNNTQGSGGQCVDNGRGVTIDENNRSTDSSCGSAITIDTAAADQILAAPLNACDGNECIQNGSFEVNAPTDIWTCCTDTVFGWDGPNSNVDWQNLRPAADGEWYVDVSGTDAGFIAQTFNTIPGTTYVIQFALSRGSGASGDVAVEVSAGDTTVTFTSSQTDVWEYVSMTFTATSDQTSLKFTSQNSGSEGPHIDDIAVEIGTIFNGSFEGSNLDDGSFNDDATEIDGWAVSSGTVGWKNNYWTAQDGTHSVDLNGSNQGSIETRVATTPGASYELTFWLAGNPDGGSSTKTMDVLIDGNVVQSLQFDTSGQSRIDMGWQEQIVTFTATGAETVIRLASTTDGFWGPVVDNVSLERQ